MHYSMFSAGPHSDEEKILNLRKVYNEAFSELDVDLVLSGHEHLLLEASFMRRRVEKKAILPFMMEKQKKHL